MEQKATYNTTKELLLRTPLPQQTRTYKPVSHEQVINLTLEGLVKSGFEIERELYSTAKDGLVANGRYFIKNVEDKEMQLQVAWQNSYDKTKVLSFSIGCNILVCTNGMMAFRGIGTFRKKHQGEIQTFAPNMIPEYINQAGELFSILQKDREAMKQYQLNRRTTAELLGRMYFEEHFLESTQLNIIKREIEKPSHDYSSKSSLWELYQFTTFAIGGIHPSRWMDDHIDAHRFFTNVLGDEYYQDVEDVPELVVEDKRQLKLFDV